MGKTTNVNLKDEFVKIIDDLIIILDAYEGKKELVSNQGQALDGHSALAKKVKSG